MYFVHHSGWKWSLFHSRGIGVRSQHDPLVKNRCHKELLSVAFGTVARRRSVSERSAFAGGGLLAEEQDGHAHAEAVGYLLQNAGIGPVGYVGGQLDTAVYRARVHD